MIRNLIFHVTPIANYKWNIEQLIKRWPIFTGKKVIAIATDRTFDTPNVVKSLFPKDLDLEFIEVKNHPLLRETKSLPVLLERASEFDRSGTLCYFHSKGVTRKEDPSVMLWTRIIYHYGMDLIEKVDKLLLKFPVVGCCKRYGKFETFPRGSTWHYSGTIWTARLKDLFERNWQNVPLIRYGAEAYISLLFKDEEAGCTWGDRFQNGYRWSYMKDLVKDEIYFKKFLDLHKNYIPIKYNKPAKRTSINP